MYANICEAAKLATNNWHNAIIDIINNSNNKSDNNCINVDLAEFEIHITILLVDNIKNTYCRWAINNYINSGKINIIKILMTNC